MRRALSGWIGTIFDREGWRQALFGVEPADAPAFTAPEDPTGERLPVLLEQLRSLYDLEAARASEARARSDQLLNRIAVFFPLYLGAVAATLSKVGKPSWAAALYILASSAIVGLLATALLLVMKNLGREIHYEPVHLGDLITESSQLRPASIRRQIIDYAHALSVNSVRNEVALERRILAHLVFTLAVLVAVPTTILFWLSGWETAHGIVSMVSAQVSLDRCLLLVLVLEFAIPAGMVVLEPDTKPGAIEHSTRAEGQVSSLREDT